MRKGRPMVVFSLQALELVSDRLLDEFGESELFGGRQRHNGISGPVQQLLWELEGSADLRRPRWRSQMPAVLSRISRRIQPRLRDPVVHSSGDVGAHPRSTTWSHARISWGTRARTSFATAR